MNEVIKQLLARTSVRAYTDKTIGAAEKQAVLEAAFNAPTAGNQQLYTIIDITDETLKQKLSISCDNQPFIGKAQMVLIFLADCQKWFDAYLEAGLEPRKPGVGDLMLAVSDACIAAQNAVVAAQSLGIGSCYIGDIMENIEVHREMLGLSEYVFPCAMLVFGYPTQQQLERKKPERVPIKYIVHENGYRRLDGKALRGMLQKECTTKPFEQWIEAFIERKYNSDFAREMTRSVQAYLDAFEK